MKLLETRRNLLELLPPNSSIAEIGVWAGDFSEEIIKVCNPRDLFLVDIWSGTYGSGDKDGNNHTEIDDMELTYLKLLRKYQNYASVHVTRMHAAKFLETQPPQSLDAVYIDGDHSYDAVMSDLIAAAPTLKRGGALMGHDYYGDIKKAVDSWCITTGADIHAIAYDGCPSFLILV